MTKIRTVCSAKNEGTAILKLKAGNFPDIKIPYNTIHCNNLSKKHPGGCKGERTYELSAYELTTHTFNQVTSKIGQARHESIDRTLNALISYWHRKH